MKDAEFIELLNLYVDHEISAVDAARLEAEVQANPERRRTYQQYCRMQKACKLLASDFETPPVSERKIVPFKPAARARRSRGIAVFGALAAAACVAFVFSDRSPEQPAAAMPSVVQIESLPVEPAARTRSGIIHAVTLPAPARPALIRNPLYLSGRDQAEALFAAAAAEQADAQFEWMRSIQLEPVQSRIVLDNLFESQPMSRGSQRTYSSPRSPVGEFESVGFQFNK